MDTYSRSINGEMELLIPAHIKNIRAMYEEEHKVVIPEQCDEFIARCIRTKDGNLENAVKLIRGFQVAIANFRQWDAALLPSLGLETYKAGIAIPMKYRASNGLFVIVLQLRAWNPQTMNFDQAMAFLWMITQHMNTQLHDVQSNGYITVWDFSGFTLQQGLAVRHWKLLALGKWAQNGVAGRMKALHSIHHPKIVGLIYKGLKPFLKEKLKKRITLHDSVDSLVKHMGENHLPTFLGGTLDPEDCVDQGLVQGFFNSAQFFQDMMEAGFPSK